MATQVRLPTSSKRQQAASKALWNDGRSASDADFFTFGYSGRDTNKILEELIGARVSTVVDIRLTPVSMYRPDFSKRNLRRIVESYGLEYIHLPELGVPREIRSRAAEQSDLNLIWAWYDEHVIDRLVGRNLHRFYNFAEHPLALMCVEFDPEACHRHRLFQALEDRGLSGFDL